MFIFMIYEQAMLALDYIVTEENSMLIVLKKDIILLIACKKDYITVLTQILQYSNFATVTNLHLCKPSKMVIWINFLMDNDIVYVFLYFSLL